MPQKMHVNTRPKSMAFSLKTLSAAIATAVVFSNAYGAGLGKLTVLSGLGQPLNAEIELTSVSKGEAESLSVKLASVEAFRQANIEFNPALFTLRFAVEPRGGRQVVRITSTQPLNEPFVDLLLELAGGNSRLVREYTFLLDPPELRRAQPAQVAAAKAPASSTQQPASQPITRAESVPQPTTSARSSAATAPQAQPARSSAAQPRRDAAASVPLDDYEVKSGDTLARIAGQFKPEGISLDQMLVALQRANPDAFISNNINRLRAGQILSIPDAQAAGSVSGDEAKSIVVAQAADFNAYRNKLAERIAAAEAQKSDEAKQSATGKITAKVEEQPTAASESKDKLTLSRSGAAALGADAGASNIGSAEDRIAKEKALAEANARVKELEKNVGDLQKLLEIKNKELAERQSQANAVKPGVTPPAPVAAASDTATKSPDATAKTNAASPAPAPETATAPATSAATAPTAADSVAPAETAPDSTTSNTDTAVAAAPAGEPKPVAPDEKQAAAKAAKPSAVVSPAPSETSFIDDFLENPLMLAILAALLAGLGGIGIYSARRKKLQKEFNDNSILTDSSSLTANSLFGSTGGQSVDTNNSVFNSNFAPSASQLDTNEVDPVAEADVYIAYGRDAQAEEILKEALRTQPDRNAVRVKLLEIYANRKDLRAFEMLASELYSLTKGEGEDWGQAAGLGIEIDPQNPLYAGGKPSEAVIAKGAALTAPTQPLDELNLDALLNTTQTSTPPLENLDTVESGPSYFDNTVGATAAGNALPDLEMNVPTSAPEIEPVPTAPAIPEAEKPLAVQPVAETEAPAALDFDFDLPGLGLNEPDQPKDAPASTAKEISDTADNGLDFDFNPEGFTAKHAVDSKPAVAEESSGADDEDFGPLDLNISANSNEARATSISANAPTAQDFDLSGINLDLSSGESIPSASEHATDTVVESNLNEMATKLDLAIAYQEIGDKDGARELLDEVVKGGTSEQTEKARSLLLKIA